MRPSRENIVKLEIRNWINRHSWFFVSKKRWYVGITNNPKRRRTQHKAERKKPFRYWKHWDMGSMKKARALEHYFSLCGLSGGKVLGNARSGSRFIYVYRI